MVKAIRVHETGGPEVLLYEEIDLPAPGPGEVQIRQHAIGVNFIDVYFRTGLYPSARPFVPGQEGAGEVIAVGPQVSGFTPGDRVAYCGANGAYAQARNVAASLLVQIPASISYETAAAMMLKGLTAEYLLFRTYPVKKGDVILVHAAAGGVGLLLCQWAKHLGATVIGTVGSEAKAELAKKAGADEVILYRQQDFVAEVRRFTKGAMCNVVYDGVGKDTFPASLDCLRTFGTFVSFGAASGPIEAFNIGILAPKGSLYVTRPTLGSYVTNPPLLREMAARLTEAVGSGVLDIAIHSRVPLAQAADAHRALEGRATTGATILLP